MEAFGSREVGREAVVREMGSREVVGREMGSREEEGRDMPVLQDLPEVAMSAPGPGERAFPSSTSHLVHR